MVSVKVTRDTCNGMGQHVFLSDWKKMRLNTHWMRQHCWMWQRLHTQCATVLCKKYVGSMTFRTAYTIVSYSTRHSTKPSTTTRHGHVVNFAVSLCAHAHKNTQIPCTPLVSIEEEKGKHVTNMFMPQMSDPVLLLHVKRVHYRSAQHACVSELRIFLLYNPHLHSTRNYTLSRTGSPFYAFSVRAMTKCALQKDIVKHMTRSTSIHERHTIVDQNLFPGLRQWLHGAA